MRGCRAVPTCNLCGFPVLRLHGGDAGRRCLRCFSTFRHRAVGAVLGRLGVPRGAHVYELSSRGALCRYLRRTFARVTVSELFDDVAPGGFRGDVQCQDVQRLTYPDASFDLVTSTEVFEHVPDDGRAFAEVHRVLRPGGHLAFTVPLMEAAPTLERARLERGAIVHLVEPEYHGDRLRGRGGVLAFRTYGPDILERLREAGFAATLERIEDPAHAIDGATVVVGRRPV
jgi:SAM-dependent methyltransferase